MDIEKKTYEQNITLAKQNEAYHRKKMEYYQEEIKILENINPNKKPKKTNKGVSRTKVRFATAKDIRKKTLKHS